MIACLTNIFFLIGQYMVEPYTPLFCFDQELKTWIYLGKALIDNVNIILHSLKCGKFYFNILETGSNFTEKYLGNSCIPFTEDM